MKKLITLLLIFISINSFSQNPLLLKDVSPGNNTGTIQQIVKTSNYTFFNENDGGAATDRSLYRTDGTPGGTIKLNLTYPTYISTKAEKLTALGNKIIFAGDNFSQYGEIWASDGTQAGTVALERFQPISSRIPVVEISAMGSYAYYSIINKDAGGINRAYLRRTDGTLAGTSLVYDFSSFTGVPEVVLLTSVNNILYFIVYDADGTGVDQLWRSDGTNAGTYMVYNFTTANFVESYIMPAGNNIYIMIGSMVGGVRQNTIWKSDGTTAGTVPVKLVGTGNTNTYPPFAVIGSTLYFAGVDGNGKELWKTDGTAAGTFMVSDINPGSAISNPANLTVLNGNTLYFSATTSSFGNELWKYDGIATTQVKDIYPGTASSNPLFIVQSNGALLFSAANDPIGNELWISDGTAANTKMVTDMNPFGASFPGRLTPGNPVYFTANDGTSGVEVFKYENSGSILDIHTKLYVNDNATSGDLFTTAVGNNANAGTKAAPVATISYAVSIAQPGDTIFVDAGTYAGQVLIDKGITIRGAGIGATIINPGTEVPATLPGIPLGVVYSTSGIGDVFIKDVTINSGTPQEAGTLYYGISLQTGGSITGCEINGAGTGSNTGWGIYIQKDDQDPETISILNNHLHHIGFLSIKINVPHITAVVNNNTIDVTGSVYGMGLVAGGEPHLIDGLDFIGNKIIGITGFGVKVNCSNSNVTISNNSFEKGANEFYTSPFIQNTSMNPINASCNWFGSADAEIVRSRIQGYSIGYGPWLSNGADNNVAFGFQPLENICNGRQNKFYVNDNSQAGDALTTAVGNNSNNGFSSAPFATLNHAISIALAGDTIYIDAGSYAEQVIIDKGITIRGAGQNLTSFVPPATPLVPPPGSFTEIGLFETTQGIGDVHVSNLLINSLDGSSQNIIIQGGGSVKNCRLLNGGQGVYFRVESVVKTVVIENNFIQPNGIGINCQGSGLTATIINNTISRATAFYAGIFAGLDFGPVSQLTISNNIISNCSVGMMVGSANGNYNNNSFVATSGYAIQRVNGNTPNASCNWFGTNSAQLIQSKISGNVNYGPWLIDGTDSSPAVGFQSSGTCPVANSFYVNDNSQSGDVFTTAIGNDANTGTFNSPFATLSYAISQVPVGATIFVDAGIYPETITVNKSLTLRGAKTGNCPGASLNRGNETIIVPPITNFLTIAGNLVTITARDVKVDGFTLDGDNPTLTSGYNMNGADVDGFSAITNNTVSAANMQVVNCIIKNFNRNGIGMSNNVSGINISCNHIDNLARLVGTQGIFADARAINMFGNNYGSITNNYFTRVSTGIIVSSATSAASSTPLFANNTISSYTIGINIQEFSGTSTPYEITGNTITTADYTTWNVTGQTNPSTNANEGMRQLNMNVNNALSFTNNNISGCNYGMNISQVTAPGNINISGGNISGSNQIGIFYNASVTNNSKLNLDDVSLINNNIAIDASYVSGSTLPLQFNNITISGGTIGLRLKGNISVPGGILSGINFSGQSEHYIQLINNSFQGQVIDGSSLTFEGLTGAEMTLPGLFTTEDKIAHSIDYAGVGFLKIKPLNVFLTQNSFNTTLPIPWGTATSSAYLQRAIGAAVTGDSIYVDAGTYSSGNFTIDRSLTLLGTNFLISPNDIADPLLYNSSRNTEAIISNSQITLAADNIRIQGFTFNTPTSNQFVLSSTAVANDSCNNIKLEKNRFISSASASNVMVLTGKAVSPATTNNFLIHDNRMENATAAYIRIDNFNNFTITKNTFIRTVVPTNAIAIRQNGGRIENLKVEENVFQYWDATVFTGGAAVKNFIYNNNKAYNTLRGVQFNPGPTEPISLTITNNLFQQHPTAGIFPSLFISRNSALNAATPNSIHIEANTFTYESTGQVNIPPSLVNVNVICNNNSTSGDPLSSNFQLTFRKNIMSYTGNLSGSSNFNPHGLRFEGKLAVANIDNNEITYSGTNLPIPTAAEILRSSGIFIGNTSVIPPGAVLNINNNKVHGFNQSIAFYNGAEYGGISPGVIANINNNSFTGDLLSINNGTTSQPVNATCNWYGSAVPQDLVSKVSNGSVIYSPWLTNGTDNDVAIGFQPVLSSCAGTPVVATLNASTNISCFGANNGAITITISGGTIPYTIEWSKDGNTYSSDEDLANLAPGTYSVTVTDANSSVASITNIVISQPLLLTASASGANVSCFGGSNGSASVIAGGGTLPYTYLWSNGSTNASISNLSIGIYSVTVTDGNGCTQSASYQVTQPTLLTAVASGTSTSCANTATVVANGGTTPYSYAWSNGATTQSITSIPAGTYTVIVTDNKGCTASSSVTVTATEAFNPSASVTNVSCFGGNNGAITITNVNGVGPFQFSLNGVSFSAPSTLPYTFSGLAAGTYTITVKDANGCTGFVDKTITQSPLLVVTQGSVQNTCSGQSTGSITVTATGGSGSLIYSWTGPGGYTSTQKNISGLAMGSYTLTVTDTKGCSKNLNVNVPVSPAINVTEIITNILCSGSATGAIDLTVTGGTGSGFIYLWNNGATTQDRVNLAAGSNYKVTITDINSGCTIQKTYAITQPSSVVGITVSNPSIINVSGCNTLGSFTAQGSGGTQFPTPDLYRYSINGVYQTSPVFNNLQAGNYTVTVKDYNGCLATRAVTITDNGSDEYEGAPNNPGNNNNNARGKAAPIGLGATVSARIGIAGDLDYYKLGTANLWTGNYTITFVQPATAIVFDLVASNGTTIIAPTSSSATAKQYNGLNGTYYVRTSGTNSLSCYQFTVTNETLTRSSGSNIQQEVTKAPMKDVSFDVRVLGNPTSTSFIMNVITSSDEKISMRIFDAQGRLIEERQGLQPMETLRIGERYINGIYMAEIRQGKNRKTVRLVKM